MAGFVKTFVGKEYGSGTLNGTVAIKVGAFLNRDLANGYLAIPSGDATGRVVMVCNEVDHLVPYNVDDSLFEVAGGGLVKFKDVVDAEEVITDQIGSTFAGLSVGDELGVGANGLVYAIADLTALDFTTFKKTFTIKEKTTLYTRDALVLVVNVK